MTTDDTDAVEEQVVPSVDDALEELYGLLRDDFIPRRDELAKQARAGGDRETAAAIVRLRKPSAAAWLANMLAREHPDEIGALEDLGASMRDAQDRLEGDALRRLSRQRHELVNALVERARRIARDEGVKVGDAVVRELERTVGAALADQEAARALTAGHLVTSLEPGAGLGGASASAPATSGPRPAAPRPARRRSPRYGRVGAPPREAAGEPSAGPATRADRGGRERDGEERAERERVERAERERAERERDERERDERERAERERREAALAAAHAEAERADEAARAAREAADEATAGADEAAAATAELRRRLAAAEQAERAARDRAAAAERDAAARGRDAEDASARVERAERDLTT